MWFELLLALKNHLEADPDLQGLCIQVGAGAAIPSKATIVIIRGPFTPKTNDPKSIEELTIYIECWEYDDRPDFIHGYEKISQLEQKLIKAINEFGAGSRLVNGKKIKIRPGEPQPDGDSFRPSIGSRTAVSIRWH
jgi:hypothetical protein